MNKLLQIFESRFASVFCLIFAIANRIIFATLYSTIGRDARTQVTFAKNLLAGKGMGVTKYFTADLDSPVFDTTQYFPPGFSFAIIPFLKLFHNEYSAALAFDIVNILFFFIALRTLAKDIGLPIAMRNILMLTAGCSMYPFFINGSNTDLIGLTLVLFALSYLIKIINQESILKLTAVLFYGFLFFLPFLFRYMYLPVSLLFPALIYMWGVVYKKKALRKNGLLLLGAACFYILVMMFLSFYFGYNFLHVIKTDRGIYFDQLVHWYPFIPASFINLDFLAQLTAKLSHTTYTNALIFFELLNILLFLFLVFAFARFLYFFKKQLPAPASLFIINGSLISLCILSELAYFSLIYKPQVWGLRLWNFNDESRYFAFIYIFLPFVVLLCLSVYKSHLKKNLFKGLAFTGLCFLFLEIAHGIYYNVKIISGQKEIVLLKERLAEKDSWQFSSMLKELEADHPEADILISSSDVTHLYIASQMGYKAIFDYNNLNKVNLTVNKKSFLLFIISNGEQQSMQEYLQKRKPQVIKKMGDTLFYLEEINP